MSLGYNPPISLERGFSLSGEPLNYEVVTSSSSVQWSEPIWSHFPRHLCLFVADNATYKSPCRSVRPSVGRFVPLYFFGVFELFEGRIARVLVSYGCLCPCPNHFCPCPTHYCPCSTARDRGSLIYDAVQDQGLKTFSVGPKNLSSIRLKMVIYRKKSF